MHIFSQNLKPGKPSEAPQFEDGISGPAFEAPGLGRPWRPPRHLLKARALQPRPCHCMQPCGAAFGLRELGEDAVAGGWRRKSWATELHRHNRQRNDECFGPNIFESVQSKNTFTNTLVRPSYVPETCTYIVFFLILLHVLHVRHQQSSWAQEIRLPSIQSP